MSEFENDDNERELQELLRKIPRVSAVRNARTAVSPGATIDRAYVRRSASHGRGVAQTPDEIRRELREILHAPDGVCRGRGSGGKSSGYGFN